MYVRQFICTVMFLLVSSASLAKAPLVIALDADLSAVAKTGGIAIERGTRIAIEEINAAGGVLGRTLELKTFDHRGNPARGIANIKKIAELDNVVAVMGGVHTPVALQEIPLLHEHKLIYLDPWAAGTPVVDNGHQPNFVFRVSVRDSEAGKVLFNAAKKDGIEKVALLLGKNGWGRSNEKSMTLAAQEYGLEIVSKQWVNWKQTDMKREFDAIIESGAQAIMLVLNAPEGAIAMEHMLSAEETKDIKIYSHWGLAGGEFVSLVGLKVLSQVNLQILQTYSFLSPSNPALSQQVLSAYQRLFDADATAESIRGAVGVAQSYDLVYLLKSAIEKAGSTDRVLVRDALEQLPSHKGLLKHYAPAFTATRHDALWAEDYFMTKYNERGHLIPVAK
jgi:branched-chain amino acid transport system substrate-binding protein